MIKLNLIIILIIFFFKNKSILVTSKNLKSYINDEEFNDIVCPDNCLDQKCDNETLKCDSCIDGFYSDKCDKTCPTKNCKKCEQGNGKCKECNDDLIVIDNYCCENNCKRCNDEGCLECESLDQYGLKCEDCPKTCKKIEYQRKCAQDTGKCLYCDSGKRGNECTEDCNKGCDLNITNCGQDDGKCKCIHGYYGDTCDGVCDPNCEICNENNGICSQCKSSYYVDPDDQKLCKKCPENCDGECQEGKCNKCKTSFYGETCDKNCSINCKDYKCEMYTGECECINHFSKESNCQECTNYYDINTNCTECINYFDKDSSCQICIENYDIKTNCSRCINHYDEEKNCKECKKNYDIKQYCKTCIPNYDSASDCTTCINQFDIKYDCKICLVGYYGNECDQECNEGCDVSKSNCHQEDGKCDYCKSGYYDESCSKKCNPHCLGEEYPCDPKTGDCENCEDLYYGPQCQYKTDIPYCIKVDKQGNCLACDTTYYLTNGLCKECSSNCTDKLCQNYTGKCDSCSNINAYGDFCNLTCSIYCNENGTEYICNRETGKCNYDCVPWGNFSDDQCRKCQAGYYPEDEGCNRECSDNCEEKSSCSSKDGSCNGCKIGWYGSDCSTVCSDLCKRRQCNQEDGACSECIDGYYKNESQCIECPVNCSTCNDAGDCVSCKSGRYGKDKCDKRCSINCEGEVCEIDGNCDCKSQYYGENCKYNCEGCSENGCEDRTGNCIDHYCLDSYYDPRQCNEICSENCENKKCDIFTGECISCPDNKYGKNCEKKCSEDCKEDGRLDCCYIKDSKPKGFEIDISYNNDNEFKEGQSEFSFINITLGGYDLKILIDFETNSPLVIFDAATDISQIDKDVYIINSKSIYDSSKSKCIKEESSDAYYEYDGFFLQKEINAKDTLKIKNIEFRNFSFLICQDFKIDKDFDKAGEINGIVGLGLRNYFTENLFYILKDTFPKNILVKTNNREHGKSPSIYFGDYPEEIRKSFSKLSTMLIENKKAIAMDKLIEFETKFTGIAYSLRKAYQYQYDKNVKISNRIETNIVFNNLYKQFFEKIYFGDLYQNGCYLKLLQGSEAEYYCKKAVKAQLERLPKLGLILGDYIYYLSHDFLYKESDDYYTFIIKLNGQGKQRIDLGKSFFNEFSSIIYNNGNETLNFFGDIKKLTVPLRDPSNLLTIDSDIFTPGGWVTLIIFITVLIIIFCYLIKYCGEKTNNEEDEEDDMDYEEDSLIDETLE